MSISPEHARQPLRILEEACETYNPSHIFLFFSGGYDSFVSTYLSYEWLYRLYRGKYGWGLPGAPVRKVIHVNTGIGIAETRDYVHAVQYAFNWPYAEYTTPERYEEIVKRHGFPGPAAHRYMYVLLKERAINALVRDHTPQACERRALLTQVLAQSRAMSLFTRRCLYAALAEEYPAFQQARRRRFLFITGVRREESTRRMGHVQPIQAEGRRIWVAPLIDWTKNDILDFMEGFPRNPVVDTTHKSGECLCGSFAHKGELDEICFWYPETGAYLKDLERVVQAEGFPWGWEEAPPSWWQEMKQGQDFLPGLSPLCSSCDARHEAEEAV